MSLKERLLKNSTIKKTDMIIDSIVLKPKDWVRTPIPALNLALSGRFDGGLTSGLLTIAGPSRSFKSLMGLLLARSYMKKYPDAILLFYDSEYGISESYLKSMGIDLERVIHSPLHNIEELKLDIVKQLDEIKETDRVFIFIDSLGNLASMKEHEDALKGETKTDMTRAKSIKSLFRIVTPYLVSRDIPLVVINHVYDAQGNYPAAVVSGGTGVMLSSSAVWIIGRRQDKDDGDLIGYNFIINIEKGRAVKEKSKIPISVSFEGGISKWSGLIDMAMEHGSVTKPKPGWYTRIIVDEDGVVAEDKNWRLADTFTKEFWEPVFEKTDFAEWAHKKYSVAESNFIQDQDDE